jgi:hypothetical protein
MNESYTELVPLFVRQKAFTEYDGLDNQLLGRHRWAIIAINVL